MRDAVPVNVTVPAVGPERAHEIVLAGGCRTAKVKVAEPGQTLGDDEARLEAVRDALGPDGRVRVDANGGWDVDDAVGAIRLLDRAAGGLEYVEQPCATVEELAAVRRAVDVPIAADESIRRAADPYRVRDLEAADIAVLKVQPLGGVRACLRIAEDIGLPVVVSQRARDLGRHRRRAWRWRPRCPSCPTPAGSRPCSCSPTTSSPTRCCRSTARCPVRRPHRATRRRWTALAADPGRVAHWRPGWRRSPHAAAGSRDDPATRQRLHRAGPRRRRRAGRRRRRARSCWRPGSRNAPLAFAAVRRRGRRAAAAAHPHRRAHRRVPGPRA